MAGKTVLVIDDEKGLTKVLKYNLEKEGYRVLVSHDGEAALAAFRKERPDLIVLDLMLPKRDGLEVCKAVRQESDVPVLMLTAKKDEMDRVLGLELGADDYVTKPFSVRELLARVKIHLRRTADRGTPSPARIRAGTLEADLERYEVRVDRKPVHLSPKEFQFFRCLLEADGRALTRDQLLEKVWGYEKSMEIDTTTVDQHVARLRAKLGPEAARVVTVKNVGYRFKTD